MQTKREASHRSCDQKWMCQLLSPNLHGCNHNCLCVPEEIGIFTAFQCNLRETIKNEIQTCSHIYKYMEKAKICVQTCMFTFVDKQDANRNKRKVCSLVEDITKETEYKTV